MLVLEAKVNLKDVGIFTRFVSAEAKHMRWLHVNVEESLCLFVSNSLFRAYGRSEKSFGVRVGTSRPDLTLAKIIQVR